MKENHRYEDALDKFMTERNNTQGNQNHKP